jgi:hypothetical protein
MWGMISWTKRDKGFETWHYTNLEGGGEFIFVDLRSNGLYELIHSTYRYDLIHSTYRKETSYPNWESYLEK